jgi:succinoglycan biosynthesis protein ExoO
MQRIFGSGLYCEAWDLTEPTEEERALVRAAVQSAGADVVMVNYAFWAPVFADLGGVWKVILMHDLLSARVGQFESLGWALDCPDIRVETERTWLREADVIVAAQTQEAEQVRGWVTGRVLVGPVALRSTGAEGFVERERCLFVGSNAMPNVAGLQWFLRQVWPAVRAARPGARLAVAGSVGGAIDAEERDGVEKLGVLPSLDAEYARAAVCVVPLVMGSGVKIKLIEALSFGKATVATGLATEGLAAEVSSAVVVCDYPAEFAAAVVRLMTDDVWRSEREEAARQAFAAALDRGAQSAFLEAVLG